MAPPPSNMIKLILNIKLIFDVPIYYNCCFYFISSKAIIESSFHQFLPYIHCNVCIYNENLNTNIIFYLYLIIFRTFYL